MNDLSVVEGGQKVRGAYVWRSGVMFWPSRKEWVVMEEYIRSRDYKECSKALLKVGVKRGWLTCKRWLERGMVKEYVGEKLRERAVAEGLTRERWVLKMVDHVEGRERLMDGDLYAMKLLSAVCGWEIPEGLNFNQEIRIVQQNGRE